MERTTAEVAQMAGVTSRTLRHYDAIGLVRPSSTGPGGVRRYGTEELLRLQEVLVLRELGLGLEAVAGVLSGSRDRVEALRAHERRLRDEAGRSVRLAETVARTIAHLEGDAAMSSNDASRMFEGLEDHAERVAAYEAELVGAHGEGVRGSFREAEQRTSGWGEEQYRDTARQWDALSDRFVDLLSAGEPARGEPAQQLTAEHHSALLQFWTPDRASYQGLGETYVSDPRFREGYDAKDPRLAEYLRDAMAVFAERRLT